MYTNKKYYALFAIILFSVTIISVTSHGRNNRVFLAGTAHHVVESPEQAYQVWASKKLKGRILLLFDTYPHLQGRLNSLGAPELNTTNFLEHAIADNMIRKIFFIVADSKWQEFRRLDNQTNPIREYGGAERGVYLFTLHGVPFIAIPHSSLPQLEETPLVYINAAAYDQRQAMELLRQKNITSDCLIALQSVNQ
jgi:hypothetical protein